MPRDRNVRRIVIGRPRPRPFWAQVDVRGCGDGPFAPVGTVRDHRRLGTGRERRRPVAFAAAASGGRNRTAWGEAVLAVAIASACSWAAEQLFPVASLSVIYMTAVVVVASRRGLGPAIAAAVLGFLAYNFLFTDPRYTFHVSRAGRVADAGPVPCRLADHRQSGRPPARPGRGAGRHRRPHQQALRLQPPCRCRRHGR